MFTLLPLTVMIAPDKSQSSEAGKVKRPELWDKLTAFEFDAATGSEPFSVKLAAAEGWDDTFTARVVEEYRRFLYLTQVSDGQATPSEAVDSAWHMHLTFSRSYWDELCPNVLGASLHHEPCEGAEDMPRYRAQYADTLTLYAAEFGHLAPSDIWPDGDTEPEVSPSVFPKWFFTWAIAGGMIAGLVALVLVLIAGVNVLTIGLLSLCGLVVFVGLLAYPSENQRRRKTDGGGGSGVAVMGDSGSDNGAGGCGGGGCGGGGGGG